MPVLREQLLHFLKLDLLTEELRIAGVLCHKRNYAGRVSGFVWNNLVVDVPQSQVPAIVRQFPNDLCVFFILPFSEKPVPATSWFVRLPERAFRKDQEVLPAQEKIPDPNIRAHAPLCRFQIS